MKIKPIRFIGEPVQVEFDQPPRFEKRPDCPQRFVWQGETLEIAATLSEWHDYERRGRMAVNMRPSHIATASGRGSWGVGRFYFRVRLESARIDADSIDPGRIFDLYYDRAPKNADDRKGGWFLLREMAIFEEQ
jgi:hypothetical protein